MPYKTVSMQTWLHKYLHELVYVQVHVYICTYASTCICVTDSHVNVYVYVDIVHMACVYENLHVHFHVLYVCECT